MSMYDDLDPAFVPSPGAALPAVAARVHRLRMRRRVAAFSVAGVAAVAVVASVAFGSSGAGNPRRLSVAHRVTTTDVTPSSVAPTSTTRPTRTATTTTRPFVAPRQTVPVSFIPDPPPSDTTTTETTTTQPTGVLPPGAVHVTFAVSNLAIDSGTSATITYTVANAGDRAGNVVQPECPDNQLWPDDQSRTEPLMWPVPVAPMHFCPENSATHFDAHESKTFHLSVVAGLRDEYSANVIPSPGGDTIFQIGDARLPVTIAAPAAAPITVDHPSAVTTGTNQQHVVDFTITNHLGFPVRYVDAGPCSQETGVACYATTPDHAITMDVRLPPYDTAVKPLYLSYFLLGADEVKTAHAQVHGTTSLEDIFLGSPGLPPGIYHFDWDGQKVPFTITP